MGAVAGGSERIAPAISGSVGVAGGPYYTHPQAQLPAIDPNQKIETGTDRNRSKRRDGDGSTFVQLLRVQRWWDANPSIFLTG